MSSVAMTTRFLPAVVVARVWLNEPLELAPGVRAEPLDTPLGFENEVQLAEFVAEQLGARPASDWRDQARRRLEHVLATAMIRFPPVETVDGKQAVRDMEATAQRACDALSMFTHGAVVPVAIVVASVTEPGTVFTRFFPPSDPSYINVANGAHERASAAYQAAENDPVVARAIALLRTSRAAPTRDMRLLHLAQAIELLVADMKGTLAMQIGAKLKELGFIPAKTKVDPSKTYADVVADVRNKLAHGKELSDVEPYARPYVQDDAEEFERRTRQLVEQMLDHHLGLDAN